MNLKEFVKDKKLEVITASGGLGEGKYGYALFCTGFIGRKPTNTCLIFDKNLNITYMDNNISWINDDWYTDIFSIRRNDKYGVIDPFGNEIVPCIYDNVNLSRGYCDSNENTPIWVEKDNKEMFFDRKGNQLTELYDKIFFWDETSEYFIFNNKEYSGVLDSSGKELFRIDLYHLQFLTNNILIYRDNFQYGLIDITGKILTDAKYTSIQKITNNQFLGIEDGFKVEVIDHLKPLYNFKAEE